MENVKIGDIVAPVPIYDSAGSICGQKCKCRHESGNVDLDLKGNRLTLYDVPTVMLRKVK